MQVQVGAIAVLSFLCGIAVQTATGIVDPANPFGPLRFDGLPVFQSAQAGPVRHGYGVALKHTAGDERWEAFGRNSWGGKGSANWEPAHWLTFGSANSQQPHAGLFIDRARGSLRYTTNVEAKARETKAFQKFKPVFSQPLPVLNTSLGDFDTIRFAYRLEGAGSKNCLFFHGNAITPSANVGGYVCEAGRKVVPRRSVRCFIETLVAPDLQLAGRPGPECADADRVLGTPS